MVSAATVLVCGVALAPRIGSAQHVALGGLLRADALTVTMLIVIGVVATLTTWASIGYIDAELEHGHTDADRRPALRRADAGVRRRDGVWRCAPTTSA